MLLTKRMFLAQTKGHLAAQREASRKVAQGKTYSVELPIVGRVPVPSPEQLAIYAALGGLAVLELIDWPVAVAMGVGSALVSRHISELENRGANLPETREPAAEEAPKTSTASSSAVAAPPKKAPARKPTAAKKAPATSAPRKVAAQKITAKKTAAKKAAPKKTAAKRAAPKKTAAKKAAPKKTSTD